MRKFIRQLLCRHQWYYSGITWVPCEHLPFMQYAQVHRCRKCGKVKTVTKNPQ